MANLGFEFAMLNIAFSFVMGYEVIRCLGKNPETTLRLGVRVFGCLLGLFASAAASLAVLDVLAGLVVQMVAIAVIVASGPVAPRVRS